MSRRSVQVNLYDVSQALISNGSELSVSVGFLSVVCDYMYQYTRKLLK